jgi:glycosyltransferase involved in cell wall biosynthesis
VNIILAAIQDIEKDINGAACHAKDLKSGLESAGHAVRIITPYHPISISEFLFFKFRQIFSLLRRKTERSFFYLSTLVLLAFQLYWRLNRCVCDNDMINAQDVVSAAVAVLSSRRRIPVVLTCHFGVPPWCEFVSAGLIKESGLSYHILKYLFLKTIESEQLHFVCVSKKSSATIRKIRPRMRNSQLKIIYPGVAPPVGAFECPLVLSEKKQIINVGLINKNKNQRILLDVAQELKRRKRDYLFVLVGPQDPTEIHYVESESRRRGLTDYFSFLGPRDRSEVFRLMGQADLYFHTSTVESFGMTLIEAMSVGTCVVSMAYDAAYEILTQLPEAIFPIGTSIRRVTDKLIDLIENEEMLTHLLFKEKKIFEERFSCSLMAREFDSYYKRLTGKS